MDWIFNTSFDIDLQNQTGRQLTMSPIDSYFWKTDAYILFKWTHIYGGK